MRLADARRVVVVDLGFGDAGKGTVTDSLVRRMKASAVVRFNGGAQAGHTVVLGDGRHHTFAQLGAGTFVPGVRTFLSRHVVLHPTALLVEAEHLARLGVADAMDRLHVSEACLVTTPVHQAAICVRELARGASRHGSCGVGVGETVRDSLRAPDDALRARDLRDERALVTRLRRQQEEKREELREELRHLPDDPLARQELAMLTDADVLLPWAARAASLARHGVLDEGDEAIHALLASSDPVVFEGAQGVLLDEWVGFHPYTTWSTCTWSNAEELLREHGDESHAYRLGVLRAYATRHGAGPFPTESPDVPPARTREHNVSGPWQGSFRTGWLDAVLTRYALAAAGPADGLALTHLDRVPTDRPFRIATEHDVGPSPDPTLFSLAPSGRARDLRVGPPRDLAHVEALGHALSSTSAHPFYREVAPSAARMEASVLSAIEQELDAHVVLTSSGPTAADKRARE